MVKHQLQLVSFALYLKIVGAREPGEREEVRRAKGFIRDLFVVRINTV